MTFEKQTNSLGFVSSGHGLLKGLPINSLHDYISGKNRHVLCFTICNKKQHNLMKHTGQQGSDKEFDLPVDCSEEN